MVEQLCLNPYCSGRWSRTGNALLESPKRIGVLILIVVEDGLVPADFKLVFHNDLS